MKHINAAVAWLRDPQMYRPYITLAQEQEFRESIAKELAARGGEPWRRCPSTHCERRGECASPHECLVKSALPSPAEAVREMAAKIAEGAIGRVCCGDYQSSGHPEEPPECCCQPIEGPLPLADIAAAIRSMPLPPGGAGWRTMESAPRDGTTLLLFLPDSRAQNIVMGYWSATDEMPEDDAWYQCKGVDGGFEIDVPVTHWMPLPPAPEQEKQK